MLPFTLPLRSLDERGNQLACILQTYRGVLAQTDAPASVGASRPELGDRKRGHRGLLLGGAHLVAAAHGVDGVEIHRQRGVQFTASSRVQRIISLVRILDAGKCEGSKGSNRASSTMPVISRAGRKAFRAAGERDHPAQRRDRNRAQDRLRP